MLAVVPARGGSKGMRGKNVMPLCGKPLICHTLESALLAKSINRVLVTTDDPEILQIALSVSGVEAPFLRPSHLATDTASAIDAYLHVADWLSEHEAESAIEECCVLLPTSPLRLPEDIDGAISLYMQRRADIVVSVTSSKPIEWHQAMTHEGRLIPIVQSRGMEGIANRQSLERTLQLNGSIYVLNMEVLRKTRTYFGENTYGYAMPASRSIDIDDADDFLMAEVLMRHRQKQ